MSTLKISDVSKSFGSTQVLDGISLSIERGEFVSLVGPSGCGKSTLLRIIAGLESQDAGTITLGDRVVDGVRPSKRNLAMVFQSYALYPHLTVAENIGVPLRMRHLNQWERLPLVGRFLPGVGAKRRAIRDAVEDAATSLDIHHLLDRKPGQLSGGQRQRVAVGRALVRQPEAFLLDEPLSNLDAKLRVHMRAEIAELHRRLGVTFIYVTHDQVEAMTMSDRMAVMMDGKLLQVAPPHEIYANPVNVAVAEFIGSPKINTLPGEVREDGAATIMGAVIGRTLNGYRGKMTLGIRPEALQIGPPPGFLPGTLRHIENLGNEYFLHVEIAGMADRIVCRAPHDRAPASLGAEVGLDWPVDKAHLFDGQGGLIGRAQHADVGLYGRPYQGAANA